VLSDVFLTCFPFFALQGILGVVGAPIAALKREQNPSHAALHPAAVVKTDVRYGVTLVPDLRVVHTKRTTILLVNGQIPAAVIKPKPRS
jgi:hypothetical protein